MPRSWFELFDRGQYKVLSEILHNQQDTSQAKLSSQLTVQNNIAICNILSEPNLDSKSIISTDLENILKICYSIPVKEDILCVELGVLYNFVLRHTELQYRHESHTDIDVYHWVYKSLGRVCKKYGLKVTRPDVVVSVGLKTSALSLLNRCIEILPLALDSQIMLSVMRCAVLLCVQELTKADHHTAENIVKQLRTSVRNIQSTCIGSLKSQIETDIPEIFILPIKISHLQILLRSAAEVEQVSSMLIGMCLCRRENWEESVIAFSNIVEGPMKMISQFLSGFSMYKSCKYTEGISSLMEILRSSHDITQRTRARIYNLIGKCFDKMGKSQLSIQMFKEALSADFSYLVPLYNTSLQYRQQNIDYMELECLNLLVTAIEMREPAQVSETGVDLMCLMDTEDEDIPYILALYLLARRSLLLKRFEVAAEKYEHLIEHLRSSKTDNKCLDCIPPLLQVHHEAIEALLMTRKYEECIALCDKVLLCYQNNSAHWNYSMPLQTFDHSVSSQSQSNTTLGITQYSSQMSLEQDPSLKRKRKFSEISGSQFVDEHYGDVDVISLRFKADALVKTGDKAAALVCLERAIDSLTSQRRVRLQRSMQGLTSTMGPSGKQLKTDSDSFKMEDEHAEFISNSSPSCSEPKAKRQRVEPSPSSGKVETNINNNGKIQKMATSSHGENVCSESSQNVCDKTSVINIFSNTASAIELECKLYEMTAEILESLENKKDAVHFKRLARHVKAM